MLQTPSRLVKDIAQQHRNQLKMWRQAIEFRVEQRCQKMILVRIVLTGHLSPATDSE